MFQVLGQPYPHRVMKGLVGKRIKREKGPRFLGGLSVELPGIEPGSFVTLPGLLRAQSAQNLCSALRIGRTRPDDGPSHQ